MDTPRLNRNQVRMRSLSERRNKQRVECDHVAPSMEPNALPAASERVIEETVGRMRSARDAGRPVMLSFGAHTIKNGLGPVLVALIEEGWVTHLATNGAGIIHDWEFAFQGQSSEDVAYYMERGEFGNWQETGYYINLALNIGAYRGHGYGASVGALIHEGGLEIPSADALRTETHVELDANPGQAAAAADLAGVVEAFELPSGRMDVPHPWRRFSIQAAAYAQGVPFTGHPMFGHDIIYNHPMNHGALLGRAAERDFLAFAESVSRIEGGVYLSLGSAVMSPMVFEKSMSMAQNLAIQRGEHVDNHYILVVDLAESKWDWSQGEPPQDDPAYYLRYNKTFSRTGGTMRYLSADNRDFLLHLYQRLSDG